MANLNKYLNKAKKSPFYLWLLNFALARLIPFNKPHYFKIDEIGENHIKTSLPYKKANFNHIQGLHACALATLTEFTCGVQLLNVLDSKKYRIILQKLEMEYHYQGKTHAKAHFELSQNWIKENVLQPLESQDAVVICLQVKIHDVKGNLLTTGNVHWQVKPWEKVRTK
jgi:acyl-coenzyme A thioesterase PaaI-like protein